MVSTDVIGCFADIGLADRLQVGGKGGSLGELQRGGIAVPPGFVVKTLAFEKFIASLERVAPVRARIQSLDPQELAAMGDCCADLRARVEETALPAELRDEIAAAYNELCGSAGPGPVAVRSSATTEDAADASFAGLQDTYLWVRDLERVLL